tara:strand:- start:30 stop:401 length:372 start_codon:yes stop_codon:yes gene_type:complete
MNSDIIFADTYALVELLNGNPNYNYYAHYQFLITQYNLMELYYNLLRENESQQARKFLCKLAKNVVPVNLGNIRGGMKFKLKHKKDKLSYADCIGWAKAKELGVRFLTGDNKFEEKTNGEYVK